MSTLRVVSDGWRLKPVVQRVYSQLLSIKLDKFYIEAEAMEKQKAGEEENEEEERNEAL